VYQIERDPSERFPIDPSAQEWKDAMAAVTVAVRKQEASLALVQLLCAILPA
jgi:hypothetical protein